MKIIFPFVEVHREKEASETQIVVSVKVTDEDVINLVEAGANLSELHLHSLTTIYQIGSVIDR
jgi:hypothetical protein